MSSIGEVGQLYEDWRAKNPNRPAYEFGFSIPVAPCKVYKDRRHFTTSGEEPVCDCIELTARHT